MLKPAKILLPHSGVSYEKWAVLACDQFTSQPEYWQNAESFINGEPSALNIILPEVYLEDKNVAQRIEKIHSTMREYENSILTKAVNGFVYVERITASGKVRQGLIGAVDLEQYSYEKGSKPLIRPSESTVVERIPPRLAVRRGACLEAPHILMLIDDDKQEIIETLANEKSRLELLYDTTLMLGGKSIKGWAVTDKALLERLTAQLNNFAVQQTYDEKYPRANGEPPIAFAVGDGNHSLATAKAYWQEVKGGLSQKEQENHPARYCLVELENIHSSAIEIEPIHRVVFGISKAQLTAAAEKYFAAQGSIWGKNGEHKFEIIENGIAEEYCVKSPVQPLAVGSIQSFLDDFTKQHSQVKIDYIHGRQAVSKLSHGGNVGIILPAFEKADLFKGIVLGGMLPRKTFSMGHAEEKRYYIECRKLVDKA